MVPISGHKVATSDIATTGFGCSTIVVLAVAVQVLASVTVTL